MSNNIDRLKNLFLRQSYIDTWEDYERSINRSNFIKWDYMILTASNEAQASTYKEQVEYRLKNGCLPEDCHYAVLPDPGGKRVGSGGATFNVMRYIIEQERKSGNTAENVFAGKRILVIHSGGDSKRVPQYSAIGKLFSPVPRELPDGRCSTLFDEFVVGMSGVPSRMREGMLVLSGDVLLLFNPLQIDALFHGAAAISIKEDVSTGKNHGVFLSKENDYVDRFLHKQTEEYLNEVGAVNEQGCVDLDTGAILFDSELLMSLFSLISTDGEIDEEKYSQFVSEEARISFYGDFLYPLANESTLEQYYKEAAEGTVNDTLLDCRTKLWEALHDFSLKLICLSPAEFIHFGTTRELRSLLTEEIDNYTFLDWKKTVFCTGAEHNQSFAAHCTYLGHNVVVEENAYLENSYLLGNSTVGSGAIVSNLHIRDKNVPADTVWHGLKLTDDTYTVRVYGVLDNPKGSLKENASFLGTTLEEFISKNNLKYEDLWSDSQAYLWFASLYPACDTVESAQDMAVILGKMAKGVATEKEISLWKASKRESLYSSFNKADIENDIYFKHDLESRILANKFIYNLKQGQPYREAAEVFGRNGLTEEIFDNLIADAKETEPKIQIRIYYALSRLMKHNRLCFHGNYYDELETMCFKLIQNIIYEDAVSHLPDNTNAAICQDSVHVALPVRVNWGGGWTDTPPYCNENGGTVLNAAIKLNGILPVQVTIKRLEKLHIEFESQDIGVFGVVKTAEEIQDCNNPYDSFALHKAALIACGIIPLNEPCDLKEILKKLGGGIYLSTQVIGIPKGSGLGTSSILSAACVKALYEFLGKNLENDKISEIVLGMEQIMSTGGGWQDQVGGLSPGIKFIRSKPGVHQILDIEQVLLSEKTKNELQERFALIYTGQRRLARNLLRDVVGNYIGAKKASLDALKKMSPVSALMKYQLEQGNIDEFAKLLDKHWELSKQLDIGCTNTCIDQIFMSCEDMICGKFISGAGGGGFLQVILKPGVTKAMLKERILEVFQNSGVDVWDSEFLWD